MSDASTDDKIERLVRSVLEAVDLRLADVRHELQTSNKESDRRILALQQELRDLALRIDRLDSAQRRGAADADRTEQQLVELRSGLARLQQQTSTPPSPITTELPRINDHRDITAELPTLERATIKLASFEPVTTQVPLVAAPAGAAPSTPESAPAVTAPPDENGQIDVDQLAALLNERLSHLDLPRSG